MSFEKTGLSESNATAELLTQAVNDLRDSYRYPERPLVLEETEKKADNIVSAKSLEGLKIDDIPVYINFREHKGGFTTYLVSATKPLAPTPEIDGQWAITLNPFHKQILEARGFKGEKLVALSDFLVQDVAQRLHRLSP